MTRATVCIVSVWLSIWLKTEHRMSMRAIVEIGSGDIRRKGMAELTPEQERVLAQKAVYGD